MYAPVKGIAAAAVNLFQGCVVGSIGLWALTLPCRWVTVVCGFQSVARGGVCACLLAL